MGRLYRQSARLKRGTASEHAIKLLAIATALGSAPSKTCDSHLRTVRRSATTCRRCCRSTRTSEKIVRRARRPNSQSWPPRRNLSSSQKYSVHGITKIRIAVNRMSKRPPKAYAWEIPSIGTCAVMEVCFNRPLYLIDPQPSAVRPSSHYKELARFALCRSVSAFVEMHFASREVRRMT